MKWRKLNSILHRDIGYLCIGLTLIYAVSGVAVNHISHQFNPSYSIKKVPARVVPLPTDTSPDMKMVEDILSQLGETAAFKNVAMLSPGKLRIFVEGNTIDVELASGAVMQERVDRRPLLYEINSLHLNKPKKIWTYAADIYAVLLAALAITGIFMIRGKNKTRGTVLTLIGFVIPLVFIFFYLS